MRSDDILKHVQGPKVLDVGCTGHVVKFGDPGWLHGRLRDQFKDVSGVDISESNLKMLQDHGYDNLHLASAENFELPDRFNTVVAGELIEHLSNPGMFLDTAKKHLAPGGRIIISTPYAFSLLYFFYAFFKYPKTCQNEEHAVWFCLQTMKSLTERAGLKIDHVEMLEDYDPNDPSGTYRTFVNLISIFRPIIPARLRKNVMLFVLTPST
ncbi:MAG: class I SAM-dependent methyltransferase [Chloroflexi bacterium]|nr:class I SAM-dependent methyltransferase [Chloroflexota bacterium]